MNKSEQKRFDELYRKHLRALKLQGMSDKTVDGYARAVRRLSVWFDCCPDRLEPEQLAGYFAELVESHSWSTVKLDRCGLQFFYKHVPEPVSPVACCAATPPGSASGPLRSVAHPHRTGEYDSGALGRETPHL